MIAILDSGIGGFELLNKLIKKSNQEIYYYSDTKNFPYGNKTEEEIKKALEEAFKKIEAQKIRTVILACNTASVISNKFYANNRYKSITIINIYKAIKIMAKTKELTILCTQLTKEKLNQEKAFNKAKIIALPKLAELIENNKEKEIKEYIKKEIKEEPKKILYACTHYPLIENILKELFINTEFHNPINKIIKKVKIKKSKENKIIFSEEETEKKYKQIFKVK